MKLLCILISFASVNVLVALDAYVKQVILTNIQMIDTKEKLPTVIQNMILLGEFTMVELALMLAVPEANDKDIADYIEQQKIDYQLIAQEIIWFTTSIRAVKVNEGNIRKADLNNLGIRRRSITLEGVNKLIRAVLSGENEYFKNFAEVCRLMGIFRSIKYPQTYIKHAEVHQIGVCLLTDIKDNGIKYSIFEDDVWEFNDNDTAKELLSTQVQSFLFGTTIF
ncbi:uncharacterized protein LOC126832816 [Adelges cooleyi]|uniref:uncharacterized protein LOC126832816 n=1 Tax=Adelges cooleyi TaxID=133065 RepID=UPI00217F7B76|nr:uncharacterized protein LOC126832816 [Adelges cooleyi]XP_050419749.1 uncharacterized protein LOC126832816 [Adelges cooleyi]